MPNYLQIAILAVIQGAAELLPVSSTAHVILAEKLMGLDPSSPELTFLLVMLHSGTMFAVLVYFWPRWRSLFAPAGGDPGAGRPGWHFLKMVVVATAVTGIVGGALLLFIEEIILVRLLGHSKGEIESLFKELPLIGVALALVGVLIILAGIRDRKDQAGPLSLRASLWIGAVQGLCLPFRGFSRSGATISTGLFCGMSRPLAEDFSFALAVLITPPVIIRQLYRLLKARPWADSAALIDLLLPGVVGMVLALIAGLIALRILSAALEKGRWRYFGYYCLAASAVVLGAAYSGL
jgi:undecaprenyl-diphosphatase